MSQKSNIKLKRAVIISMIGFSVFFTAAIMFLFRSSSRMDTEHIQMVSLNGELENQILRSRLIIDEIIIHNNFEMLPQLAAWTDSIEHNLASLQRLVNLRYDNNKNIDINAFNDIYLSVSGQLERIQNSIGSIEENKQEQERIITDLYNSFVLDTRELQSSLSNYLLIDHLKYKKEIMLLIILSFLLIFLGGFLSIRLINRLIGADRVLIHNTIDVENRERKRIAADLHDSLGSLLSGLMIYIRVLEKEVDDDSRLMEKIKQLNKLATAALKSIEEVINNLRPGLLSRYGLIKSIERIIEKVNELGKTNFSVDARNFSLSLSENTELIVYRICSELIANALKHARAKNAEITFSNHKNKVKLAYRDDGIGFDPKGMSYELDKSGLYNIIRRIESLEGKYEIISEPDKGVEIRICFDAEK
ncbi:MAG: histidine kinase [Bacteroidales bacterium]|nr:histidine kinase [Bacteroidales bacterium]